MPNKNFILEKILLLGASTKIESGDKFPRISIMRFRTGQCRPVAPSPRRRVVREDRDLGTRRRRCLSLRIWTVHITYDNFLI